MIQSFGWSDALQQDFVGLAGSDMIPGRVTVQQRGHYVLVTDQGELTAQISGRLAHDAGEGGYPVVGDWVAATPRQGEGAATIHAVLPRRTSFVRKAADSVQSLQVVAANVDLAFLVTSMNLDFNTRRLERYLATAWQSGAKPVIVLPKAAPFVMSKVPALTTVFTEKLLVPVLANVSVPVPDFVKPVVPVINPPPLKV